MGAVGGNRVEAGGAGDREPIRIDGRELLQADPVDLRRVEVEARPGPDRHPVQGGAVGRGPQAGLLARRRQVGAAERLDVAGQRRVDHVAHHRRHARPARVVAVGQARPGHDRRLVGGSREQTLGLRDRPLGHDPGGGHAGRPGLREQVEMGVDERPERGEPRQQLLQPVRRVRRLELDAAGQERLRPVDLVDEAHQVHPQVVGLIPELRDDAQHVVGDPLLHRQAVDRDRCQLRERRVAERPGRRAADGDGSSRRSSQRSSP